MLTPRPACTGKREPRQRIGVAHGLRFYLAIFAEISSRPYSTPYPLHERAPDRASAKPVITRACQVFGRPPSHLAAFYLAITSPPPITAENSTIMVCQWLGWVPNASHRKGLESFLASAKAIAEAIRNEVQASAKSRVIGCSRTGGRKGAVVAEMSCFGGRDKTAAILSCLCGWLD